MIIKGLFAALILLSGLSLQASENLGQLKLGVATTSLLRGRLTVRLPPDAKVEPMGQNIMAAPVSELEQTRVVLDAGPQRMVIMTDELFCLATQDIENKILKSFLQAGFKGAIRPLAVSAPLKAYAFYPQSGPQDEQAILVMSVYLVRSDSTVQSLRFYVNPAAERETAQASRLAETICATLREGARSLNTKHGDRELCAYSQKPAALITVPDGYAVTDQPGPDFVVYHIRKLVRYSEPKTNVGVYFGDHPRRDDGYTHKEDAKLFGKNVEWYERITKDGDESTIEEDALVSLHSLFLNLGQSDLPSYADVFLRAGNAVGMQELKRIAATLRFGEEH